MPKRTYLGVTADAHEVRAFLNEHFFRTKTIHLAMVASHEAVVAVNAERHGSSNALKSDCEANERAARKKITNAIPIV